MVVNTPAKAPMGLGGIANEGHILKQHLYTCECCSPLFDICYFLSLLISLPNFYNGVFQG